MPAAPTPADERRGQRWWLRARAIEAAVTALFSVYVAWPFLSLTQYVTTYDTVTYGGPHLSFTFGELRAGHIPTWNDGIFNGVPHLANAQTAPFNPVKLVFLPLEVGRALELITAANILLMAAGTLFLLSRRLQLKPPAGFVGTAAVVGGGLVMARSTQFEQMSVVTWLPWLLAGIDWAAQQPRFAPRAAAAVAVPTALMLVAGHPNQVYVCLPLAAIWALTRIVDHTKTRPGSDSDPDSHPEPGRLAPVTAIAVEPGGGLAGLALRFATVGIGVALGTCLAAPQLLPMAAQLSASVNSTGRPLLAASNPGLILTPNFIPSALVGQAWSDMPASSSGAFEAAGFVGITVCILALVGVGVGITRRGSRFTVAGLSVAAVAGILLSVGSECHLNERNERVCDPGGRLFRLLFENLPGFNQARVPGRWILITSVALAILAAMAVDALAGRHISRPALLVAGGLGSACAVTMLATPLEHNDDIGASYVVWVLAGALTLAAVTAVALASRCRPGDMPSPRTGSDGVLAGTTEGVGAGALASAVAVGVLVVLVIVELGGAQLQSAARHSLVDKPFTAMGGATSDYLRTHDERNLSLAATPPDDYPYLSNSLRPNANLTFGSRTLDGYDGGLWVTKPWVTAVEPLTKEVFDNDLPLTWQIEVPPNRELLARFGVRYIIVDAKATAGAYGLANPGSAEAQAQAAKIVARGYDGPVLVDGPLQVFENPNFTSEGLVYFNTIPTRQDSETMIKRLGEVQPDQAIVPEGSVDLRCPGACPTQPVTLDRPRPGIIKTTVETKRKGFLVVSEQGAAGWTATVDGNASPIIPVDSLSQGVVLETGTHTVELTYQAPGLKAGLWIALVSLALIAICLWDPLRRTARAPAGADR